VDLDNTVALDDQGLDITAGTVGIDNTVTTTTGGAVNIANSGVLTIASGANMNLDGAFDQDGSGAVSTAGNITTKADDIKFDTEVTLTGDVSLNTGAGIGDIEFASDVSGDQLLTLTADTGNIDLSTVGGTNALSGLLVNSAATVDLDDTVALDDEGLDITADAVTVGDKIQSNGGDITVTSTTGNITLGNVDGILTAGTGNVSLIAASGSIIVGNNIDGEVTTDGTVYLKAQTIGASGNHQLDLDGATALEIVDTGSGDIEIREQTASTITSTSITVGNNSYGSISIDYFDAGGGDKNVVDIGDSHAINNVDLSHNVNSSFTYTATAGDITVGTVNVGNKTVTLTASNGTVTDSGAITADKLTVDTSGVALVGGAITLDYGHSVNTINLTSRNNSNIQYVGTDGVGIELANAGTGDVTITADGDVTDSGAITADKLTVNTGGAITLDYEHSVNTINMTSGNNSNIQYVDTDDINVELVNAGGGIVTIQAVSGAIHDAATDTTTDITAGTVDLDATTGIGSATEALEIDVDDLEADTTTGGITLTEASGLASADVTTTGNASHINITTGNGDTTWTDVDTSGSGSNITLTSGTGTTTLTDVDTVDGDITIVAGGAITATDVQTTDGAVRLTAGGALTATMVTAADVGSNEEHDVTLATSAGGMYLQSVGADHDIRATATSGDIVVDSLTADGTISLEATEGAITQSAGTITTGGSLNMTSDADLDMANYTVASPGLTNLTLDSTGGSAIVTGSAADDWLSITAAAQYDVVLAGNGDIRTGTLESRDTSGDYGIRISTDTGSGGSLDVQGAVNSEGFVKVGVDGAANFAQPISAGGQVQLTANGDITTNAISSTAGNIEIKSTGGNLAINENLTSDAGGVSLISETGKIYTPDGTDTLNVDITGYSDTSGAGVNLPFGPGKTAISIISKDDLKLGTNTTLTANGKYSTSVDDRPGVDFDTSPSVDNEPIDVAIYLRSYRPDPQPDPPIDPSGHVDVKSEVKIADYGTMVIDAGERVTFENQFYDSKFYQTNRLEVVSRISKLKNELIIYDRLPYAKNPEAIRDRFDETPTGYFAGAYVLRGELDVLAGADVLDLANPVPLAVPRPLEPELRGEVERPDTEVLENLLSELGIGVQPYVTDAYAASLSTDLRLYSAAEKLQQLIPVLEDADGTRIVGLRTAVAQFFPSLDVLSEEQMDSFAQELTRHKGDGTDYDLAGQCIFALTEYVNILGTDIGWPVEKSVGFVMGRYVPRLTEGDEIRIAVIQMQLQKALGAGV
jgi:hypothetical protein